MATVPQRKALITGAAGGMGRACSRLFGATHDLVLVDAVQPSLERFADELRAEGYKIIGVHAGDLGDDAVISALMTDMAGDLPLILIHTAGLSPALSEARPIMAVNFVATVKLLDALEPVLLPGSAAVLIASSAGHQMPEIPAASALMANPLAPSFLDDVINLVTGMSPTGDHYQHAGISYSLSKQGVLKLVQQRSKPWGARGARITSISPGMILTPMGQKEVAANRGGVDVLKASPLERGGNAMDIALAARFLASDESSFITGCDLLVDGGSVAAMRWAAPTVGS